MRKSNIHIFIDFDGTITTRDSLQAVLDHFTGTGWRSIEERVTSGELEEKDALQMEFDLLKAHPDDVMAFISRHIEIDPYFSQFIDFCRSQNIQVSILSGGFLPFIKTILTRYSLDDIEIHANQYRFRNGSWEIIPNPSPRIRNRCNHCKTYHLLQARIRNKFIIYIGDGNTDRCPSKRADLVFAKGSLAAYLKAQGKMFIQFESFDTILKELEGICYNLSELTIG